MQNIKYIIGFILLLAIGYGALQWVRDYQYKHSAEYAASQYYDELQQRYQDDTYGGSTPEETLALFIDALKKGDVDLASKYFEIKKQDEAKNTLITLSKNEKYISEISKAVIKKRNSEGTAEFTYQSFLQEPTKVEGTNIIIPVGPILNSLVLQKINNKWKISEL